MTTEILIILAVVLIFGGAAILKLRRVAVAISMLRRRTTLDAEDEANDSPPKRFTGPWRVATIIYFAGAVIALYVYSKGHWGWDMPLPFPFAVFAPVFVSLGLLAIYTDEFQLGGGRTFYFYRGRNPIKYWVCVATILSIGIVLFVAGIGIIGT